MSRWGWMETPGALTHLTPVTQISPFFKIYRGLDNIFYDYQRATVWRASASYVTGAHSAKLGYQGAYYLENIDDRQNDTAMTFTFIFPAGGLFPGSPPFNQVTKRIAPWLLYNRTVSNAVYAQDQWTIGRLTLQGAVRYDYAYSFFPEGAGSPVPNRWNTAPIVFPRSDGVRGYHDITPRMGGAWDVFGNGKTSVRLSAGKYLQTANNQGNFQVANPAYDGRNGRPETPRFQIQASRIWADFDRDFVPDCNLDNSFPNGECSFFGAGGWDNLAFSLPSTSNVNDDILHGWGIRPWDWQIGASVQHEVIPRVSVEVGYHRRWFGNFFVTNNTLVGPGDFQQMKLAAPQDGRLPDGGGYTFTYNDISPAKFGQTQLYYSRETDFTKGEARTSYWHGVDVTINARLRNGLTFQGGTSSGRGVRDTCALWAALPELTIVTFLGTTTKSPLEACHVAEPVLTQVRGLASYEIPKVEVLVSTAFRSVPGTTTALVGELSTASNGISLSANDTPTPAQVQATLGRPSPCPACQYNLLLPGQMYVPRLNYVDFRAAKVLRFGRTRTQVGFDLYNLFNDNTPTGLNQNFGTTFLNPTAIQTGRLARFNITLDF